ELCSAITGRSRLSMALAARDCWMVTIARLLARAAPSGSLCRAAGVADRFDVAMVGAAAAAHHGDVAEPGAQLAILAGEFRGIAVVQRLGRVELRVAEPRGIGAQAADALYPALAGLQRIFEVIGVSAIDHVVGRAVAAGRIDRLDRLLEALA